LPVPDSPSSSTLACDGPTRATSEHALEGRPSARSGPAPGCPCATRSGSIFSMKKACSPLASRSGTSSMLT
jgi:hypothetical protein